MGITTARPGVTFDFTQGGYPAIPSREDGKFIIEAKHYGSTNYTDSEGTPIELDGADLPGGGLPTTDPPEVEIKPGQPGGGENGKPLEPDKVEPNPDGSGRLDSYVTDKVVRPTQPGAVLDKEGAEDFINDRYEFTDNQGEPLEPDEIIIYDKEGNDITDKGIDLSKPGDYVIHVKVEDENGNSTTGGPGVYRERPAGGREKPGPAGRAGRRTKTGKTNPAQARCSRRMSRTRARTGLCIRTTRMSCMKRWKTRCCRSRMWKNW